MINRSLTLAKEILVVSIEYIAAMIWRRVKCLGDALSLETRPTEIPGVDGLVNYCR